MYESGHALLLQWVSRRVCSKRIMNVAPQTILPKILLIVLISWSGPAPASKTDMDMEPKFPGVVTDVQDEQIDISELVREKTVVVVTLKATWCSVCREQLVRIKTHLPVLERFNVTFLVLSPGPKEELLEIKEQTGFPYPFIEDVGLRIGRSLNIILDRDQLQPCIFILDDRLDIRWMQRGRAGDAFGDQQLLDELGIGDWI